MLTNAGRVQIGGTLATNLPVTLSTSNNAILTLPSTVVISAGQTSAVFNVTLVDGGQTYGTLPAQATASAQNLGGASASITLFDDLKRRQAPSLSAAQRRFRATIRCRFN